MHHKVVGEHGASRVLMAPAKAGTGIIAGGPMRAVFEVMGVTDIVGQEPRLDRTRTTWCAPRSTALKHSTTPAEIAAKRGKSVEEILG